MSAILLAFHLLQPAAASDLTAASLAFSRGQTFAEFISRAVQHRSLWTKPRDQLSVPHDLVSRLSRVGSRLRIVVVAEDWCTDSANTVPILARLADEAGVAMRLLSREAGRGLTERYRTVDGRLVTPIVVLFRDTGSPRAWIERPAALRALFDEMATSGRADILPVDRQRWYDADRGLTALREIVGLAEERSPGA